MADRVAEKPPLRHPAEIPMFIFMVVLNLAILGILIDFLATTALIPPALRGTNWETTWRAVAGGDNPGGSGDPDRPPGPAGIDPRDGRAAVPDSVPGFVRLGG